MLTVSDQRMPESELYIGQLMKQRYKEQETKRERCLNWLFWYFNRESRQEVMAAGVGEQYGMTPCISTDQQPQGQRNAGKGMHWQVLQTERGSELAFRTGVQVGSRSRHHSHRGDNWTVGGDEKTATGERMEK